MREPGDKLDNSPDQVDGRAKEEEPESLRDRAAFRLNNQRCARWTATILANAIAFDHGDARVAPHHLATGLHRCEHES